ncbi:hypothetical protein BGZ94_009234 [Podila epigama]|nr:hypothetical protein BGZ94_009234 [Podila epigama]
MLQQSRTLHELSDEDSNTTKDTMEVTTSTSASSMNDEPPESKSSPDEQAKTPPIIHTRPVKRPRPRDLTKHSIHRPFKSPIKLSTKPIVQATETSSTLPSPGAKSLPVVEPGPRLQPRPETEPQSQALRSSERCSSKPKARSQFRSPLHKQGQFLPGTRSSVGYFLEVRELENKVAELQASIRRCNMVLRHQEQDDTPLEELIAKWRKASQEGAQALLEKMIEQEQIFGEEPSGGFNSDYSNRPPPRPPWQSSGFHEGWGSTRTESLERGDDSRMEMADDDEIERRERQRRLDLIEQRMNYEDVEQDLPSVSEAIRSRMLPEHFAPRPPPMTKMQRLLTALGVDLDTIEYNPETDSFKSHLEDED